MNCVFCKIIAGEIPCHKVFENEHLIAFLDLHPNNPGHTLFVPKIHSENLFEASNEIVAELMAAIKNFAPQILSAVGANGFNLGVNTGSVSGQVIMHTHFHVIPRFENDGLVHWATKEMSQKELEKIAEKIRSV